MLFKNDIKDIPFKEWLIKDPENRLMLKLCMIAIVLQFVIFKLLYPQPNFMPPDSDSYIEAAFNNQLINLWPIGYSKFLRLFSCFTSSDIALVWFQYLLLQSSTMYFLFSIRYFLSPGKGLFRLIIGVSILNPLLPHISNFISSDCIFTALSIVWFTQLLWILCRPKLKLLLWHALILLLAFMVRFNALFYPCISVAAILMVSLKHRTKLISIGVIILLLGAFTGGTVWQYYKDTGTVQYSAFGGWLLGANALYGYAYAKPDPPALVPARFYALHQLVNKHMDSIRHLSTRPDAEVAIYYFWDFKSPLRIYMEDQWKKDTSTGYLNRWAKMAPLYADYGRYLVQQHPWLFLKYYLWPNFVKYYAPPSKFMGIYNMGSETVAPLTEQWFGWKSNKVNHYFKSMQISITEAYTILSAIINLLFISCFIAFVSANGLGACAFYSRQILCWTLVVWLGNMVFSVMSAPIELRYQIFPIIITTVFLCLLLHPLIIASGKKKIERRILTAHRMPPIDKIAK